MTVLIKPSASLEAQRESVFTRIQKQHKISSFVGLVYSTEGKVLHIFMSFYSPFLLENVSAIDVLWVDRWGRVRGSRKATTGYNVIGESRTKIDYWHVNIRNDLHAIEPLRQAAFYATMCSCQGTPCRCKLSRYPPRLYQEGKKNR